jgi:hypothetical protein
MLHTHASLNAPPSPGLIERFGRPAEILARTASIAEGR